MDEPRQRIGSWEVLGELARGGQGRVLDARDALGRRAALKLLLDPLADARDRARFVREAELFARLSHAALPRLLDFGEEGGHPWLAMERIQGQSLAGIVAQRGPLEPALAAAILAQVARALAYCHAQGVLHRDVKPANVLLEAASGRAVLVDLGLARSAELGRSRLTRTGEILGTPAYMAPEQVAPGGPFGDPSPLSDVYGLGATLFHLLTGRAPFGGPQESPLEVLRQVLELAPTPPGTLRAGIPARLESLCLRCLEKDPARRPASAAELAAELSASPAPARGEPGARGGWPTLVGLAALGALGVLGLVALRPRPAPPAERVAAPAPAPAPPERGREGWVDWVKDLVDRGDLDAARRVAEEGVQRWPADPRVHYARAVVRGRLGDFAGACADLDLTLSVQPDDQRALANRGLARLRLGDHPGAREDFTRATALDPQDAASWAGLGFTFGDDEPRAKLLLDRALELDPQYVPALISRAMIHLHAGRGEEALVDADRSAALSPHDAGILEARARIQLFRGRRAEALEDLERAVEMDPALVGAWARLTEQRTVDRDVEAALKACRRWLELAPEDRQAWGWAARLCLYEPDLSLAERAASRLLRLDPTDPDGLLARAVVRRHQQDLPGAFQDLDDLLRQRPQHPGALQERALIHLARHELDAALSDADASLASPGGGEPNGRVIRARILHELGRQDEAAAECERAQALDPGYVEGWLLHAELSLARGDRERARRSVRQGLLQLDMGGRIDPENRRRLRELAAELGP